MLVFLCFFFGIDVWVMIEGIFIKFFMLFKFFVRVNSWRDLIKGIVVVLFFKVKEIILLKLFICCLVIL